MERPDTLRRLCPSGLPILVRLAACRPPEEAELARCLAVGEGWLAEGRTGPESAALLLPYAADVAPARALRRGLYTTVGYLVVLLGVGLARELLAQGSLMGVQLLEVQLFPLAAQPAGGFMLLGAVCAAWRGRVRAFKRNIYQEVERNK